MGKNWVIQIGYREMKYSGINSFIHMFAEFQINE